MCFHTFPKFGGNGAGAKNLFPVFPLLDVGKPKFATATAASTPSSFVPFCLFSTLTELGITDETGGRFGTFGGSGNAEEVPVDVCCDGG